MIPPPVSVSVFAGARSPMPAARDVLSWGAFCDEIAALCREETSATDKRDLVAFGPYRLRDGAPRSAANVERMAAVAMLDVDGVDLDALRARLAELGVSAIVHGTPNDDPAGVRKARIYVQLDGEHDPADAGRVRDAVAALLGVQHDPATRNADRLGFIGRLAGTPERYVERFDGAPLALASLPEAPAAPAAPAATPAPDRAGDPARDAAAWAIMGALGSWRDYAGRKHALCGALGGMLRRAGWSRADCAELVRAWLPAGEPGVDVEKGVRWACAAWDKLPEECSGRAALDAVVGSGVGAIVEQATLLAWRAHRDNVGAQPHDDAPAYDDGPLRIIDRTQPPPELQHVVAGLDLAPGKVSVIQGYAYTAKTPFALLLAVCIAAGVPFLGLDVVQCPTLYVDFEGGILTQEREARICAGLGLERAAVPLTLAQADLLSEPFLDAFERQIASTGAGVAFIDTYSSALPPEVNSFNDAGFRVWATRLARVGERTGAMIVLLVHENKASNGRDGLRGISGHGSLAGAVQTAIALSRPSPDDATLIGVSCTRAARKGFAPFTMRWSDAPCAHAPTGAALVATREADAPDASAAAPATAPNASAPAPRPNVGRAVAVRTAGESIIGAMPPGVYLPRRELLALGGGNRAASLDAISRLLRAGLIEYRAGEYALAPAGAGADARTIAEALGGVAGFTR